MPKRVSKHERDLRLQYETYLGRPVTTSNWCYIKKKITDAKQEITSETLRNYCVTCAASGKAVVVTVSQDTEILMIREINKFCKSEKNGKELHIFCRELCAKYTTCKDFSYVQIKRVFDKSFAQFHFKSPKTSYKFSYKRAYLVEHLSKFFAVFCAWSTPYLRVIQPKIMDIL